MSTRKNYNRENNHMMMLAFKLASKKIGQTSLNPSVGCIITNKNNIIGYGSTSSQGYPHAEFNAIKSVKKKLKNSKMYITLEPCSNYGKTPPCTNIIDKKFINKVYYPIKDPDRLSFGKAKKILKRKKIKVYDNIFSNFGKNFYKYYIKNRIKLLPFVTSKLAVSKDGFIKNRDKKFITNHLSRYRGHIFRSQNNGLLTTAQTIIDDNPILNCRIKGLENLSPTIFILDRYLRIPYKSKVLLNLKRSKIIIFYNKNLQSKIKKLKKMGIKLVQVPLSKSNNFFLKNILRKIYNLGYSRILVEAGLKLNINLLNDNLIDQFYIFQSNKKIKYKGKLNTKFLKRLLHLKSKIKKNINLNLYNEKLFLYRMN